MFKEGDTGPFSIYSINEEKYKNDEYKTYMRYQFQEIQRPREIEETLYNKLFDAYRDECKKASKKNDGKTVYGEDYNEVKINTIVEEIAKAGGFGKEVKTTAIQDSLKVLYPQAQKDYHETHIFDIGKTTPEKLKTAAGMLRRTITGAISTAFEIAGVTLTYTPFVHYTHIGDAIRFFTEPSLANLITKNLPVNSTIKASGLVPTKTPSTNSTDQNGKNGLGM
jgi:hypothetical protein